MNTEQQNTNKTILSTSYHHSRYTPAASLQYCSVLFEDGNTQEISTPWWQSLANLGFRTISLMLSTKTVEKKVSNPTKVCLITNYWLVLKTNISTRLYSHLYSSRNVFPSKVSREEHESYMRKKLTQPKQKKIVTRKLSNKVSQLLTDFFVPPNLPYMLEMAILNKEKIDCNQSKGRFKQFG